ncbi:MAG: helix-turn-helix domain-containing protein [Lachnospiraceae bacterium]|nr:helix-turn-helix domain-containing protein [Lachnospiraceae bacterium]
MLEQKLYTVADVAELTGLTSRTIRNYLKDGTLHGRKIGVQWRFTEADINRLFTESGAGVQKKQQPEDVISGFMENRAHQKKKGCLLVDIPFEKEEELSKYIEIFKEIALKNKERGSYAYEVLEDSRVLRMSASGDIEILEELTARMK